MQSSDIEQLLSIMAKLRDPKDGCPWDIKQSFDSIVPYTLEEAYEVADAIEKQNWLDVKEELGDLLFQVVFYSQMAKEQDLFDFDEVVAGICEKLTRRHPHVFADKQFASEAEVKANWEAEKAKERADKAVDNSILANVPLAMPALTRADKIQKRCAQFGFDWDSVAPVAEKVVEELDEVMDEYQQVTLDQNRIEEEMGDLLFSVVNLSRHLNVNPERALQKANKKFERRFRKVEKNVLEKGMEISNCSLEQLDQEWNIVKKMELK
ncbi:TPA: nucleoside triphosphate pyrophosphohydrolase [Photobacterium damselae]|uniref:nucleoside triphosphate pyrophosphohydrolase n=1 Tax=Photobacterium damselae TaxID=38293 RepID=UPI000D65FAE9|nr:nucleoside triphosphate pyrophosphohydrolase [Photobacterium damselae]AWK81069.1 nucleoside triphosphate pyrophosphohydrolase [Photobacterium damselae]ELI6449069.1 nucleoside triphosphate pyrophosphohydrolase [Photobacterium damselae]ELV7516469.1 nucleoside triphosphate pyrophosphohydrolase [Photobacterium damselae]MCG3817549.1 nucleoside triphosphate pyrophosphohydrolase [Photobacterium damselae]BDR33404.1 nucleoside triphosphate pyrophosphohydrolase [Photobacterium damselae subsp. damsela